MDMDMSELYSVIVQLRELSAKKDGLIDELMDMCKRLQAENEELREYAKWLQGRGAGPQ